MLGKLLVSRKLQRYLANPMRAIVLSLCHIATEYCKCVFSLEHRIVAISYQEVQQCSETAGSCLTTSGGSHVSNIMG